MTIKFPGLGSLSLSEIQNEFGGGIPISLSEYYAGAGLVNPGTIGYAPPFGSPTVIPSAGSPISIGNFYGASAEPSAEALANYFWNNRGSLVRYGDADAGGLQYYPGDNFTQNRPNSRYVNSVTNTWTYANSGLPITSSFFTMISISVGKINNYPTISAYANASGPLLQQYGPFAYIGDNISATVVGNGYGLQAITQTYQGQINTVTSNSITSSHAGGNNGVWNHSYLIPGKWRFQADAGYLNFDPYSFPGGSYARTLGVGKIHVLIAERGRDSPYPLPIPVHTYASGFVTGTNTMTADSYWYNGGGAQLTVNTSSTDLWTTWANEGPYLTDRPYIGAILENYQ
jgi:hypothetical protein